MREHSPELRFLLAACSVGGASSAPEPPADSERLARLAWFHRVGPLVYERRAWLGLDVDAAEPFRRMALATLHRNLQLAAELKTARRALSEAGVPVILLKGAHLMDAVYRNPALRPMSDLDLLIRPEDAARACHALAAAGFHADPRKAAFTGRIDREIRLDKSGVHDLHIELHTDLNRPTRHHWFPMDALWERSIAYVLDGEPARALSAEDNAVFLAAHAVPHAFGQLIWLRDIAGLMAAGLDGDELARAASEAHARRAVQAALALAASHLGAPLPSGFPPDLPKAAARLNLDSPRYSTLASLRFRAALADTPADAASILAAALSRKIAVSAPSR